jgi:hypothetical protein
MKSPSRNVPRCSTCIMDVVALVELRYLHIQLDSRAWHVIYHVMDIICMRNGLFSNMLKCNDRWHRNYAVTGGTGGTRAVRVSAQWSYGRLNRTVRKLRRNSYGRGRNTGGCEP